MYPFGSIVLARFPFTDLSAHKLRPALVVSKPVPGDDVIVCLISSVLRSGPAVARLPQDPGTGLKRPSVVRFDKLATLHSQITGVIGEAPPIWLAANAGRFAGVFGFVAVNAHGPGPNAG